MPWQAGGYTNINNLTFLCAYHNGINDDDPQRPTGRGYMYRLNTGVAFIPPWGAPITAMPEYQEALARLNAEKAATKAQATTPTQGSPTQTSATTQGSPAQNLDTASEQPPEEPPDSS